MSGDTLILEPSLTPNLVGIVQNGSNLIAVTGCCKEILYYSHDTELWFCSSCESTSSIQPKNPASMSSVLRTEFRNKVIASWVTRWTGLTPTDFEVVVTQ